MGEYPEAEGYREAMIESCQKVGERVNKNELSVENTPESIW
jgi:hypothetical protein